MYPLNGHIRQLDANIGATIIGPNCDKTPNFKLNTIPLMIYYSIIIDGRKYLAKDTPDGPEIKTEIGWLPAQNFLEYLIKNEKENAIIDLAQIGLDRLLGKNI
jgi:hypothetical protein